MKIGIGSSYVARSSAIKALAPMVLSVLAGCGDGRGGGSASPPAPSTYSVTGTITGLTGSGLVIASGTSPMPISAAGAQTFATSLATGASYSVTVTTQPTNPSQTCTVANGSGTVAAGNVTNVTVACVTNTYMVGVTVSGLAAASSVLLQNNAANDLTASTNAATDFTTAIASGAAYNVTVKTQPTNPNQICTVIAGSGTIVAARVNAAVTCVTTPLTITSITPANNATNVSRSISPALSFSTALDATTLIPTNVTLKIAGNASVVSAITMGANSKDITVATAAKLLPLTQYTLTVTGSVRGQFGESLTNAITSQFTTRDAWVWGIAELIEADAGYGSGAQIAMDSSGNALAVWSQDDGTRINIWSNRYTLGTGWGAATLIETDNAGDAVDPQIAMDANGNALAVWYQNDGILKSIVSNRYTAGSGWGTAALIETDNAGDASSPQVAFDAGGDALAVWYQYDGARTNIWSNRYTLGSGWGTAMLIETDNAGGAFDPQIAFDASGNASAVWCQYDGARNNIWSNRYAVDSGWGAATVIEANAGNATYPQIAFDASGNALAVWQQANGPRFDIWSNRYTAGSGWGTAALIEADNLGDASSPQIAFDSGGNALAVWFQSDGTRYNIVSNRYIAGSGWGAAASIETDNAGDAYAPEIAFDAGGNALAVWYQSDGSRNNIWSNRYVEGSGWSTATLIETDNAGDAYHPQIALDASGNALAVWSHSGNIVSNRFE